MASIIHPLLTLLASLTRQELAQQVAYLKQCDIAYKKKWTMKGMVELYFLVFIHVGSRRIWISPCTANPTGEWTTQQARNFSMHMDEQNLIICRPYAKATPPPPSTW